MDANSVARVAWSSASFGDVASATSWAPLVPLTAPAAKAGGDTTMDGSAGAVGGADAGCAATNTGVDGDDGYPSEL